ncbi:SpoIIE family protein phosphatase [Allostreptomyces psammosilenae]|uniref:protein-serine/threonine phosphatase n=1 Tax=Allostreptomyces psammosilenae TaxID=1892865 RepID=A0A852ZPW1_9ACTN|nr:SpoIIE family protein phosphatase [Allostreptomyces psammosilenae]NYI03785.1 serine phosphatase RsbU (regulator of sigma subunit)/anti-sigma regulatory factor (Ser/Thr protein kinase)/pyruvate/2-oxoglutarate dehydrogenase complex dihydrolipoamide acyltransferase (E2) component [Allostreptomyces psammosilenae]
MTDSWSLTEELARARTRLAGGGAEPSDAEVRAEILASWQRSRQLGISQEGVALPVEGDLDPDARLIRAAAPVLEQLCGHFAGMPVTVVLADAQARIVDRRGDPAALEMMDAASLVPGASCDERFMGTSSVSMVLSTRAPFVVIGEEHFLHSLQALTCMASPVRDPVGGTVQGAVNLSIPREQAEPRMAVVLGEATQRIGQRLLELSTERERALTHAFLRARARGEHAVLDLTSGRLTEAGEAAPRLAPSERMALLESATELISAEHATFHEVPLSGGRLAVLRRRPLHHGDAEGAAVEVSFRDRSGGGGTTLAASDAQAPPARQPQMATAPDGAVVPLLAPPPPAGPAARAESAAPPAEPAAPPTEPAEPPSGIRARPAAGQPPPAQPAGGPEEWLLMVGEPRVGRYAVAARQRLSLLNEAGVRIGTTLDMRRTVEELAEVAVPRLADVMVVDLLEQVYRGEEPPRAPVGAGAPLRRVAARAARGPEAPRVDGIGTQVRYLAGTPQARCLTGGTPVMETVPTAARAAPTVGTAHPVDLLGEGVHSYLAAPLTARGAVLGVAGFYRLGRARPYEQDDLALAGELAARAGVCVDNARRFTRERDASVTLQRSLLPHETPRLPAVDVAHRYLPAGAQDGVGGDWFDVIPLSGMRVALVVGDVAGHGLQAAATMGRLRTAVRTLADLDLPPEEVLAHLDDLVSRSPGGPADAEDPATGATCLYAVYDPVSRRCTASRAGHPPPALVGPDGRVRLLELPTGPPLGLGGLCPYESGETVLPEGSVLALYTDGLLKSGPDRLDVEQGVHLLLQRLADRADPSLEAACEALIGTLPPTGPRDDVAVLLARTHAMPSDKVAQWEFPSEPSMVGRARTLVARQLTEWELTDLEYSTELVVSELVTNAVRYGGGGPISLRLLRDEGLICEVSDRSNTSPRIRRAAVTEEGGRGLFLVAQFSRSWGARYMREGKTVWAEQPLCGGQPVPTADERALLAMFDDLAATA